MEADNRAEITGLLLAYDAGEREAFDRLLPMVYRDLRQIAGHQIAKLNPGQTLNTTALVHEAYLKLVDQTRVGWEDRAHFFAVASRAMRQIVIDYSRKKKTEKRGGGRAPVRLDKVQIAVDEQAERLIELSDALDRLSELDERLARVVECRFFGGLSHEETARALGVSERTVQRDWMKAKAWLRHDLGENTAPPSDPPDRNT